MNTLFLKPIHGKEKCYYNISFPKSKRFKINLVCHFEMTVLR